MTRRPESLNPIVAIGIGCAIAVVTLAMMHLPNVFDKYAIYVLFPGIVGSMAVSNNAHAFHLWVAALLNFSFYFLLC